MTHLLFLALPDQCTEIHCGRGDNFAINFIKYKLMSNAFFCIYILFCIEMSSPTVMVVVTSVCYRLKFPDISLTINIK